MRGLVFPFLCLHVLLTTVAPGVLGDDTLADCKNEVMRLVMSEDFPAYIAFFASVNNAEM